MDCRRYKSALSDAAAGPLDAARQRALDEHLSHCAACTARLERLKRTMIAIDRAVAESAEIEPSPDLLQRFQRRLTAEPKRASFHPPVRVWAAATVILATVAGAWVLRAQFFGRVHTPERVAPRSVATAIPVESPRKVERAAPRAASELAPRVTAARAEPSFARAPNARQRFVRRGAVAPSQPFFERVKVAPGERTALIQLYALIQSGKVKPQSLFPPNRDLDKPLKIEPLRIKPISIPPIKISRLSDGSQDPSHGPGRPTVTRTDTDKETTP